MCFCLNKELVKVVTNNTDNIDTNSFIYKVLHSDKTLQQVDTSMQMPQMIPVNLKLWFYLHTQILFPAYCCHDVS